jgi:hypothetical protein
MAREVSLDPTNQLIDYPKTISFFSRYSFGKTNLAEKRNQALSIKYAERSTSQLTLFGHPKFYTIILIFKGNDFRIHCYLLHFESFCNTKIQMANKQSHKKSRW